MKYMKLIVLAIVILVGAAALIIFRSDSDHGDGHDEQYDEHEEEQIIEPSEEQVIELSEAQINEIGIELATAGPGALGLTVHLPGEITINSDRMAHITPRVPGAVIEVRKGLGDAVKTGEVMAVLESRELADTKAAYLSAIERYELAKSSFQREEKLWKEKISAEQDYLDARRSFAEAGIERRSAEQTLYTFGLTEQYLQELASGRQQLLTRFEIIAPFDGTVIDRHIVLGEVVGDDSEVFVIADLSSVWVDLSVYQKDLSLIKKGQTVRISAGDGIADTEGTISYVGPVVGHESRTALARVVLANDSGLLRPGLFVTAEVEVDTSEANVVIPKDAVQTLEGRKCVFIKDEHGFEPMFITLGRFNTEYVEIISGLPPGQLYVKDGAFELKAKIVTSTLDSHAGHGH